MHDKPFISESLAFEQNMLGLAGMPHSPAARAELQATIEKFILGLGADNLNKARRFDALCSLECFDANFEIVMPAAGDIPLAGLPQVSQRPVEYALGQFLASYGSAFWRTAIMRMAVSPRFEGALQRPLPFVKIEAHEQPGGDPLIKKVTVPAFAHTFLAQEAAHFPEPTARAIEDLARALELRMSAESRAQAQEEKFLLAAFGKIVSTKAAKSMSMSLARAPITVRRPR